MVITMAKLRMAHASTHGARKPPGPIFREILWNDQMCPNKLICAPLCAVELNILRIFCYIHKIFLVQAAQNF